ncbi:Kinesin-like protein [Phaffia rhodozyma]|uniref:Kinesin-like protein n=1 Tax=Phaffia rhodozyma TaxID=264483 RepID=A0A0F7SM40_PHARH|nr:Kinesin-like protein [Phaffia rhodozyma]
MSAYDTARHSSSSSSSSNASHSLSQPLDHHTPRKNTSAVKGGFVPQPSTKLTQLQHSQAQPGAQSVRSTSRMRQTGDAGVDVLAELNGGSTIRRVVPSSNSQRSGKFDSDIHNTSSLPLTSTRFGANQSSSASRIRPVSTPSALPRSGSRSSSYAPPLTSALPTISISSESASDVTEPHQQTSSGFPKVKAKVSEDAYRPKKKFMIGTPHIVTPAKLGSYVRANVAEEGFLSSEMIGEDMSDELEGRAEWENWQDDLFWENGSAREKENIKVSVRVRPLNPLSNSDHAVWEHSSNSLKTLEGVAKRGAKEEWVFDNVVSGSDNREIYECAARDHVRAAMEGYNAVVFAYGQTASGKTFTLTGNKSEPGVIPRAIEDVFSYIKRNNKREFLLRASYLEIYNEVIKDLLCPETTSVEIRGSSSSDVTLHPVREEVVTNPLHVREILSRGESSRSVGQTDWNERSSRSHSVFRLVIESRERVTSGGDVASWSVDDRTRGKKTAKATRTSTLSLIDLAGSEKATSDKLRSAEGKYINTSLLALKQVIATIAKNETKKESSHVSYRNSKLTRMLQPSLSGDSKVSVICTMNPSAQALPETNSTLLFATGLKSVKLNATKKEVIGDPHALIQQYQVEIAQLRAQLQEKEVPKDSSRRLSRREEQNLTQYRDRIRDLSSLILTSQSVEEEEDAPARPVSPTKIDFEATGPELQRELFSAKMKIDEQAVEIERLEEELKLRPPISSDAPESEKDKLICQLQSQVNLYKVINEGYEANLGAPLRKVAEDVAREYQPKLDELKRREEEAIRFGDELQRKLEKEMTAHKKLRDIHDQLAQIARESQLAHSASSNSLRPGTNEFGAPVSSPSMNSIRMQAPYEAAADDLLNETFNNRMRVGTGSSWDLQSDSFI